MNSLYQYTQLTHFQPQRYPLIQYEGFLQLLGFKRKDQVLSEKSEVDALIITIRRRIEETLGVEGATSAPAKVQNPDTISNTS